MPQVAHAFREGPVLQGAWLFVYGTLRQGGSNHVAPFATQAQRLSAARVRGRLHDLGAYPGLVLTGAAWVVGEIYCINASLETWLDSLEEVWPQRSGEYRRVQALVHTETGHQACLLYAMNPAVAQPWPVIEGGDWIAHQHRSSAAPACDSARFTPGAKRPA